MLRTGTKTGGWLGLFRCSDIFYILEHKHLITIDTAHQVAWALPRHFQRV